MDELFPGIDAGSTTVEPAIADAGGHMQYSCYQRHLARQRETVCTLLREEADTWNRLPESVAEETCGMNAISFTFCLCWGTMRTTFQTGGMCRAEICTQQANRRLSYHGSHTQNAR